MGTEFDNIAPWANEEPAKSDAIGLSELHDLLCVARKVGLPDWATHVAVSTVYDDKAEPCVWLEKANDYIDEDPENLKDHVWTGSYKHAYWKFFSRDELNT